jgi:nitrogen fixation protein FixH
MANDVWANDADRISPSPPRGASGKPPRELTGRTVLALMLAFFGVIVAVNAFMAREAISTFGGVETESSYRAGQTFERDVAMAKAQDAEHWQVDAKVTPASDGGAVLDVVARDATGGALSGLVATVLFERPTDRRHDRTVLVSEGIPGHFHGRADIAAGQWDLVIELSRHGERQFRSVNRIMLH